MDERFKMGSIEYNNAEIQYQRHIEVEYEQPYKTEAELEDEYMELMEDNPILYNKMIGEDFGHR